MSDFCGNYKKYNIQFTKKHRDITKKQFFIQLGLRKAWHNEGMKGEADPLPAGAEPSQTQTQKGKIHMKKNLIRTGTAIITTAALTLGAVTPAFAAVSGDTNASGSFDLADVVAFTQFLTGDENALNDPAAADFNSDGKLNAKDLTLMKRALIYGQQGSGNDDPDPVTTDDTYVTQVTFAASSVTLKNANDEVVPAASASNVTVENGTVVTITKPTTDGTNDFGDINVDGECANGQLKVNVDEATYATGQVTINLRGLNLSNSSDSPIYIEQIADECVITVKNGTTNTVSDGTSYTNADGSQGAIYSLDDLKFKGKGTLIVKGNAGDGIVGKDDIKIWNGDLQVTAVDDGIRGKDSIRIGDPDDTDYSALSVKVVSASGDALRSTNDTADSGKGYIKINGGTINLTSTNGDCIQGEQAVEINGGDLTIKTSGSANTTSAKGIKAVGLYDTDGTTLLTGGTLTVNGGKITADTTDDCLHASGAITLNAGKLKLTSGDDAVHSDNELYVGGMTAGTDYTSLEVYVTACYEGFEAYKIYQNNGNIYIIARDDGYNAAGGADGSGNSSGSTNPWGQGGWGMGGGSTYGEMNLNGGIVSVNTSFQDADGFDSNGPLIFNGGYYFGNGGDSFDCGDGYSITYNAGYAFGGLGMNGGSGYNMSSQMVFASTNGTVLATSMSGNSMTYAYGNSNVLAYADAQVSGGTNIATLGQPAIYISGTVSGGTAKTLGQGGSTQPGGPGGRG